MKAPTQTRFFKAGGLPLLACIVIFLPGCTSSDVPTDTADRKWTIHGKVSQVGSIAPRSGIIVRSAELTATSGVDGSYELKEVPEGTRSITAEASGCKPYMAAVEVRSDTKHYIYLERIGATLSGYVSNMLDGPIEGARIALGDLSDITDAAGKFALSEVPLRPDSLTVTHPRYFTEKVAYLAEGPEAQFNVLLQRDSVFAGNIVSDSYVDEGQPNLIGYGSLLFMSGSITGTIRRHIYIDFEFPAFMRDPLVKLTGGSLELCGEPSQPFVSYRVFAVNSQWQWYSLSYSRQPATGRGIATGTIGTSITPQYWTILNANAIGELLSDYRANGLIYGIVIQGQGGTSNFRSFYSTRSLVSRPRLSFKVRF